MTTLAIILFLVVIVVAAGAVWLRQSPPASSRLRSSALSPSRTTHRKPMPAWYASRGRPGLALLGLIGLLALSLILNNLGLLRAGPAVPPGEFVVRIASFQTIGEDQRQGAIVAEQLNEAVKQRVTTPMNIGVLQSTPTTPAEALTAAQSQGVDVLIWGQVAEGTTADQAGLRPNLLWLPSEPFVPRTWQGFDGHFALPVDYELAAQPLNGSVILPLVLDSLNHFGRGDADKASVLLDTLRTDYGDVLRPELPAMMRAIILWAEGMLPDAESAAREAAATNRPQQLNNLGAILLDQQKLEPAREILVRASEVAPELSQAHANLGRLTLDQGQPEAALDPLRTAAQLAPESPPIVATLGEAYRRNGQLQQARIAMQRVLTLDEDNGPAIAEQSVLALTPVLTATKQLEWELEQPPTRTREQLVELRVQTETAIAQIEALRNEFLRQAAAYGVATRQPMQRLAEKQAAVLEQELLNRRYQLMLVQIEQGRVLAEQPRSRLRRFWDAVRGARTPLQEAIATSVAALRQEPNLPLQYDYHYQQGRAAYLSGNTRLAQTQFDAAASLVNPESSTPTLRTRPEHHYGKAQLLQDQNLRDDARVELEAALAADERFFPAHQMLADMAVADKRWADAETHYRWLAQNRTWVANNRIELARTLREQRKDVEAEAELVPLANADNVEAMVMLAAIYRSADKLNEADTVLQRALSVNPSAAAVHEEAAKLALARNDVQTAEVELQRALELDPQRSSAHIALAQLYSGRGQPAAAAEQFRLAVANESNDPSVHRQLGEVLLQIGNPQAAVESFERAIELDPNAHEAHHGLATAYLALRRFDDAAREEQRALELANGNYTLAIVGLGDIDREQGRFEQAVDRYNTALERDPQLPIAYLGLGKAAFGQGRNDIALMHYRRGLDIEPNNVLLLLGVGDALLQQNDTAAAREAYQRARELAPDNAAASAGLGRTLWREGETDAALVELNRAVQLNPQDAETLLTIGEVYLKQERNEQALQAFGQAAEVRDDWFEPHFRRGVLLLQLQQVGDAIEELERTVRLNQNFAQGNYWLGRAYRAAGQFDDARRQFQRAVELQGDYFEARFFLGRTFDELGQAPDAVTTYEAILGEAPEGNSWRDEAARELDRIR